MQAGRAQGTRRRHERESGVVLFAREALLLRGGHDLAIAHKRSRAIVIKGGDAEDSFCHRFALTGHRLHELGPRLNGHRVARTIAIARGAHRA